MRNGWLFYKKWVVMMYLKLLNLQRYIYIFFLVIIYKNTQINHFYIHKMQIYNMQLNTARLHTPQTAYFFKNTRKIFILQEIKTKNSFLKPSINQNAAWNLKIQANQNQEKMVIAYKKTGRTSKSNPLFSCFFIFFNQTWS